jgi:thymidine phosphorylase
MARSGTIIEWDAGDYDGPIVDKHSTGGVGDKVSFLLAPIMAACGCYVPMISGRGLGHTGGTTDKVESIPGYNATPDLDVFRKVVREAGCAIIGQTPELAPADRRLYAIRDVTGTVESVPLITASILSKKIAAGLQGLVMDVKAGTGAFMQGIDEARELAESIIGTAARAGLQTHAVITDMNEVLGSTAGNALEIGEAVRFLRDDVRERRLNEVTLALCAQMLLVAGAEDERDTALSRCEEAVASGRAAEAFSRMVAALGGPADFLDRAESYLVQAPVQRAVHGRGVVGSVDARAVGNAIIELGGGRRQVGESLDLAVGFSEIARIGTRLDEATPLAVIHAASEEAATAAEDNLRAAIAIGDAEPCERAVISEILTG